MPVMSRLVRRVARVGLSRGTVRLRLTLLYGGISFVSGAALLAVTYLLVRATVAPGDGNFRAAYVRPDSALPEGSPGPPGQPLAIKLSDIMQQLVVSSLVALAIMSVISLLVGWIVAGRLLRPLRTITSTVRDISATNLHRRLDLGGPDNELKELGDTFDSLLDRLESSFRAQRQFVANASHELRTPLARQRVLGQVALSDPEATMGSLREAHERILFAGAQQERLIEALLTLARGQTGIAVREPFDLCQTASEVVRARGAEADYRRVTLLMSTEPALMAGHRGLTERLVANLVDNALRYNVPSGWVEVTTGVVDSRATLTVTNTGPEVPTERVSELFEPFQRGAANWRTHGDGLGLGLSIVQAIAEAHDATLVAAARPGGGLSVRVVFPSLTSRIHLLATGADRGATRESAAPVRRTG